MPIELEGSGEIILEGGGSLLGEGESSVFTNDFTECFDLLYEVQTAVIGAAQTITVGATASIPAIIEEVPQDEIYVDGGKAQQGPFNIQIKASALNRTEPAKFTAVTFTPVGSLTAAALNVLNCRSNNGIFLMLVGDPNTIQ